MRPSSFDMNQKLKQEKNRIRVLLVAPSMDILGGQAVQATRLLARLSQLPGLDMAFQPINPRLPGPLRILQSIKYARTATTFAAYCAKLFARAPLCDVIHVFSASNYSYMLWTIPALACAKLFGKKIVVNYRDGRAEEHLRNWPSALPTMRLMDAIVTPSNFLKGVFETFGLPAQSISNLLDTSQFHFRERRRPRPVFLHNRILEPLYNVECTLRAFKMIQERYPEAELTVTHDGVCRAGLERFAQNIGLRNTRFTGCVPHQKIRELYDAADIYLTSPDFDCMPGSILECYASGLPVIATRAGGIPHIIEDGRTGLLVDRNDHEAMAQCAFRLLEEDGLAATLARNGREECRKYAPEAAIGEWLELYQGLLKKDDIGAIRKSYPVES
jgi:glycosyltransferase involved in cell wall biosynthesis